MPEERAELIIEAAFLTRFTKSVDSALYSFMATPWAAAAVRDEPSANTGGIGAS